MQNEMEKMNLQEKKSVITQLYNIYDEYMSNKSLACHAKCSSCCTVNVVATSLEGHLVFSELKRSNTSEIFQKLSNLADKSKFQPDSTPNGLAASIINGQTAPDSKTSNPTWGACPLLVDNICSVYEARPFECRSFVSRVDCSENGIADMPEEIIAVNNVFKQYIEHTDADGLYGNLTDMLNYLETLENQYLVQNRQIPALMTDPKFQKVIEPLIAKIQGIRIKF